MFPYRTSNKENLKTFPLSFQPTPGAVRIKKWARKAVNSRVRINILSPLLLALLLCGCDKNNNRTDAVFSGRAFATAGKIVHIDSRKKRLQIAHGDIEGFMGAMTMWFETEEPASGMLKKLKRGDKIRFELKEVTNGPSVIFKIYILY